MSLREKARQKDPQLNSTVEIDDYSESVEFKYQPEKDEIIILSNTCVSVYGDLDCFADVLLLTNRRLVIEYTKGFFNSKSIIETFDLTDVIQHKGVPQIRLGKYEEEPALDAFFANKHLIFQFDNEDNRKKQTVRIERWIRSITQAIVELNQYGEKTFSRIVCNRCGAEIDAKDVFCASCGTKVIMTEAKVNVENLEYHICKQCGTKVEKGLNFCIECGTPVNLTKIDNEIQTQESAMDDKQPLNDVGKAKMPINQQIELLQKLKDLVDTGVLSQEEFEQKKKEIL